MPKKLFLLFFFLLFSFFSQHGKGRKKDEYADSNLCILLCLHQAFCLARKARSGAGQEELFGKAFCVLFFAIVLRLFVGPFFMLQFSYCRTLPPPSLAPPSAPLMVFIFALLNFIIHTIQTADGQTNLSFCSARFLLDFRFRHTGRGPGWGSQKREWEKAFFFGAWNLVFSIVNGNKIMKQKHGQNTDLINYLSRYEYIMTTRRSPVLKKTS